MRALMPIAAATIIASCSPAAPPSVGTVAEETVGRVAGPPQSCISSQPQAGLRILSLSTVAYGHGRTIYVNNLGAACPGLEPTATLIVEPGLSGEYCRGDRIRGLEQGANIAGPTCLLGDWVPYRLP